LTVNGRPLKSALFRALIAAVAWSALGISTNPNPLERPVILSMMMLAEATSPCASNVERRSASVAP